jgi:hypothetical protein
LNTLGFSVALVLAFSARVQAADIIPYPTPGAVNPVTYSFTASADGDVIAYFCQRSSAVYDNQVGMLVNGVLGPKGYGLDNQTSNSGDSFNMGSVHAGDLLTFVLQNSTYLATGNPVGTGAYAYSDPSLNGPYDGLGAGAGVNHIYSTPYSGTGPIFDSIPAGTYVGFEDLPARFPPDYNYTDEQFVFTDVATHVPEPSSLVLLAIGGLATGGAVGRRWCRRQSS